MSSDTTSGQRKSKPVEEQDVRSTNKRSIGDLARSALRALRHTELSVTVAAVIIFIFFSLEADNFLTKDTLLETLRASAYVAIVAAAWTLLLIVGELDLSAGSLYAMLMVVMGILMNDHGVGMWAAAGMIIAIGALIGMTQGFVVTDLGVPSFIVTLGTLSLFQGMALLLSHSVPVDLGPDVNSSFVKYGGGMVAGMPSPIYWMFGVVLLCGGILRFTVLGYHIYATGGNQHAARQAGINTAVVKIFCFGLVGASVGVIAGLTLAQLGSASPIASGTFVLDVIAAVIIGGVSLQGGVGHVYGTLIGALILGMINTGIILMGFSSDLHYVISGSIIVVTGITYTIVQGALPTTGVLSRWLRMFAR